MNILTRLKHWQIFTLFVVPMVAASYLDLSDNNLISVLALLLSVGIYYGWLWVLAINLYKKLPIDITLKLNRFKVMILIPIIYIFFASIIFGNISIGTGGDSTGGYAPIIIPIHLLSMFCTLWCFVFVAKSLKAVELNRAVSFNDYAGVFFLIWFFPIGIWVIQPRINKLLVETNSSNNL
jgi:hypothetical protein